MNRGGTGSSSGGSGGGANRGRGDMGHNNGGRNGNFDGGYGYGGARQRDNGNGGLSQNRQKGFVNQRRIETPSLNDMRARQGAVVSKFMTFMNRKNTLMIELYERAFYTRKPGWDLLANFVYNDLCPTDELRQNLEDVQFHPVKMIIFIKFRSEVIRDQVVTRLQTMNGVLWTDYGVSVRGHSLDANVKIIRILGVSPETTAEDIKTTFVEVGVGEVVDLRRGYLDPRRLPGVTNGTWLARVKILDPNKHIPPYIIRREEGELWSLNFEGRRFVCWKCGSPDHIGDKCKDQERTFEEVFGDEGEDVAPLSWAAVVKGDSVLGEDVRSRRDAMAKHIKDSNEVKAQEKKEAEEKRIAELEEIEKKRRENEIARQEALDKALNQGQILATEAGDDNDSDADLANMADDDNDSDDDLAKLAGEVVSNDHLNLGLDLPPLSQRVSSREGIVQACGGKVDKGNEIEGVDGEGVDSGGVDGEGKGGDGKVVGGVGKEEVDKGGEDEDDPGGGAMTLVVHGFDPSLGSSGLQSLLTDNELPPMGGISFTLDRSLERIFGQGATELATQLAIGFEGMSAQGASHDISDSSSIDIGDPSASSTPSRKSLSKKRLRCGMEATFGNLSGNSMHGDFQEGVSSGEENKGDTDAEPKKPRLGGGQESSDSDSSEDTGNESEEEEGSQKCSGDNLPRVGGGQESSDSESNKETENESEGEVGSQQHGGAEPVAELHGLPGVEPDLPPREEQEAVPDPELEQVQGESC